MKALRRALVSAVTMIAVGGSLTLAPGAVASTCANVDAPVQSTDTAVVNAAIGCLVNAERAAAGLPPFARHRLLDAAAQRYTQDMSARGYFGHISPEGSRPADRVADAGYVAAGAAENIAEGAETPAQVVQMWMESPPHRANILSARWRDMGIGSVAAEVYTLDLARPGSEFAVFGQYTRAIFTIEGTSVVLRGAVTRGRGNQPVKVTMKRGGRRVTRVVGSNGAGAFVARVPMGPGRGRIDVSVKLLSSRVIDRFTLGTPSTRI
jgi:uncharacterized protein YkwD